MAGKTRLFHWTSMLRTILFLAPTGQLGGAERCLVDTLWSFQQDRPEIQKVLITGSDGLLVKAAENEKTKVLIHPFPRLFSRLGDSGLGRSKLKLILLIIKMIIAFPAMVLYLMKLRNIIRREQPAIVHVLGLKMQILSLLAVPRRMKIIWNVQDYIGQRRMVRTILKIALKTVGRGRDIAAGCCSDDVCRDLAEVLPGNAIRQIETIYNTVDFNTFRPDGEIIPELSAKTFIKIGLIATYARWKGHDLFIEALAKLNQIPALPDWHGFIIGGPIYATAGSQWSKSELQLMADEKGIGQKMTFLDFQANPAAAMRGLDILVHASTKPEPFGRVIAEGQACGCVVVAVESGGSGEVFENEISGIGFQMGNANSLADALQLLLNHPEKRRSIRQNLIDQPDRKFDRRLLYSKWIQLYDFK